MREFKIEQEVVVQWRDHRWLGIVKGRIDVRQETKYMVKIIDHVRSSKQLALFLSNIVPPLEPLEFELTQLCSMAEFILLTDGLVRHLDRQSEWVAKLNPDNLEELILYHSTFDGQGWSVKEFARLPANYLTELASFLNRISDELAEGN